MVKKRNFLFGEYSGSIFFKVVLLWQMKREIHPFLLTLSQKK